MSSSPRILWQGRYAQSDLDVVAAQVAQQLAGVDPFCLWMDGPLGAGKTTLAGAILRYFGLPAHLPVTSPTYTYMNEYKIGDLWIAHLDLYRAQNDLAPEDLGLIGVRTFRGLMVEWPERLGREPSLAATHCLAIAYAGDERLYTLSGPNKLALA